MREAVAVKFRQIPLTHNRPPSIFIVPKSEFQSNQISNRRGYGSIRLAGLEGGVRRNDGGGEPLALIRPGLRKSWQA
jgi:hypothetical protein